MITEKEAQELITKWISLKNESEKTNDKKIRKEFEKHQKLCLKSLNI